MDKEYKASTIFLYDLEEKMFFRDSRYFYQREANGKKVFWGRGNGWVLGGLTEMLKDLPKKNSYRNFYEELFVEMCGRMVEIQQPDGFWHAVYWSGNLCRSRNQLYKLYYICISIRH